MVGRDTQEDTDGGRGQGGGGLMEVVGRIDDVVETMARGVTCGKGPAVGKAL